MAWRAERADVQQGAVAAALGDWKHVVRLPKVALDRILQYRSIGHGDFKPRQSHKLLHPVRWLEPLIPLEHRMHVHRADPTDALFEFKELPPNGAS